MNKLEDVEIKYNDLGKDLRAIRNSVGISIGRLAIKVGLSKGFISEMERDKKLPRLDTLRKIGRALNVRIRLSF